MPLQSVFLTVLLVAAAGGSTGVYAQSSEPPPLLSDDDDEGKEVAPGTDENSTDGDKSAPDDDVDEPKAPPVDSASERGNDSDDSDDADTLNKPRKKKQSVKRPRKSNRVKKERARKKRAKKNRKRREDAVSTVMLHGAALGGTALAGGVGSMAVVGIAPAFAVSVYLHTRPASVVVSPEEMALTLMVYGAIFVAPAVAAIVTVVAVGIVEGLFVTGLLKQSLIGVFSGVVVVVLTAMGGLVALLPAVAFAALLFLDSIFGGGSIPSHYWSDVALATVVFSTAGVVVAALVAGGIGAWSGYAALDDPQE